MASFDRHYHAVQFYKDENSLARTVASFLADGLKVGEPAILIATPSHTALVKWEMTVAGVELLPLLFDSPLLKVSSGAKLQLGDEEALCHGLARVGISRFARDVEKDWLLLVRRRRTHKCIQQRLRGRIVIDAALRMPLHADDKMSRLRPFHRFDHIVVGAACDHAQSVSRALDRLVMA